MHGGMENKEQALLVGRHIKQGRNANNMTGEVLARRLNMHIGNISNYECGRRSPCLLTMLRIARILSLDLNALAEEISLLDAKRAEE
jgi:transcriptional regulator with XRE-family HTH domain